MVSAPWVAWRRPPEERGLNWTDGNRLVYLRWRDRSPQEVLTWHRQVHHGPGGLSQGADMLAALREAPDGWFSGRERSPEWPNDLAGHVSNHRVNDIEQALAGGERGEPEGGAAQNAND
ncbi:MAG: hypothetical protein PHQ40_07125 [Anaerolineaceae bacterium]|nr:hypothetical protein [Anaerolineaceae bacterium]